MTKRGPALWPWLSCLAAFALAFVGVAGALHRATPLAPVPTVWEKLTHLAAHGRDYDTLFIGSSRVYFQIIPHLFDRVAAEQGRPTRSFNAGVAGMRPPEDAFLLDHILAAEPGPLRWVFVELNGVRAQIGDARRGTLRMQYWHDLPRLALLWRHAVQLPTTGKTWTPKRLWKQWREPLAGFLPHLTLFLREQTNLGQGDALVRRLLGESAPTREAPSVVLGQDLAGWIETGRGEEISEPDLADLEQELAERRARPAAKDYADRVSQEALDTLIEKIEQAGATPVLIIPPTTRKKNFHPLPDRARKTLVLDFSDLARFPELFLPAHRLDSEHTNTAGSEIFTHALAKAWAEHAAHSFPPQK